MKSKSKIKDIIETIFYSIFALAFVIIIFLILWNMGLKSLFIICPVSAIIIFLAVSTQKDQKKEREYNKKYIKEKTIQNSFFGPIKIIEDCSKKASIIKRINILFGKDNPEIIINNYDKEKINIYFESLEYIYNLQEKIIEKLTKLFSTNLDGKIKNFKVISINTTSKKLITEYNNKIIRNDALKKFIDSSIDDDIFFEITSDIGYDEMYGIAYINSRTKGEVYFLDNEF